MPRRSEHLLSNEEEAVLIRRVEEQRQRLLDRYAMLADELKVVGKMLGKLGVKRLPETFTNGESHVESNHDTRRINGSA